MHKIQRRRIEPQQQQRLPTTQRQEYQLTKMLLLQISSISISAIPYAINTLYNTITSQIQKDSLRTAQENLSTTVINFLFYLNFAVSFYIYLISSKTLRKKFFRKFLSTYSGCKQVTHAISTITAPTANNLDRTTT
ncbi:unnamed protein product, partial [Adineta steineri]